MGRKILIVSDVSNKISGVVNTLSHTARTLEGWGHDVLCLNPATTGFWTVPMVGIDGEFKMALPNRRRLAAAIEEFAPHHIHLSTEGTMGQAVRQFCLKRGLQFTTAFHTIMPDYLYFTIHLPKWFSWWNLRQFHSPSAGVMVPTHSVMEILKKQGFTNLKLWSRGVDTDLFHPRPRDDRQYPKAHEPIFMYVGRVSVEKGIEEFLNSPISMGTKYVIGDGPQRDYLQKMYPEALFLGYLRGEALATAYANANVIVFPSKTDSFGNTITEALASGTPVAAFPAPGPIDIIGENKKLGTVNENLALAMQEALEKGDPQTCVHWVTRNYTWEMASQQFLNHLVPVDRYNK